jgi:hypothetical protein
MPNNHGQSAEFLLETKRPIMSPQHSPPGKKLIRCNVTNPGETGGISPGLKELPKSFPGAYPPGNYQAQQQRRWHPDLYGHIPPADDISGFFSLSCRILRTRTNSSGGHVPTQSNGLLKIIFLSHPE